MKRVRIMIADDHDIIREGLRAVLAEKAWDICAETGSGSEAVALARQHHPDVVLMDFSMPGLNGLEATRRIRKEQPATEVLILTMHDSEELAREALAAGALGFLLKTDTKKNLVPAVQALAAHKRFFVPCIASLSAENDVRRNEGALGLIAFGGILTSREREIVQLVAEGNTSKEIATLLGISVKTVDVHRCNILQKLNLRSVSELVRYAIRNQIIQP
jgi:DNA-binding NarL/FixJ family response regulator